MEHPGCNAERSVEEQGREQEERLGSFCRVRGEGAVNTSGPSGESGSVQKTSYVKTAYFPDRLDERCERKTDIKNKFQFRIVFSERSVTLYIVKT